MAQALRQNSLTGRQVSLNQYIVAVWQVAVHLQKTLWKGWIKVSAGLAAAFRHDQGGLREPDRRLVFLAGVASPAAARQLTW